MIGYIYIFYRNPIHLANDRTYRVEEEVGRRQGQSGKTKSVTTIQTVILISSSVLSIKSAPWQLLIPFSFATTLICIDHFLKLHCWYWVNQEEDASHLVVIIPFLERSRIQIVSIYKPGGSFLEISAFTYLPSEGVFSWYREFISSACLSSFNIPPQYIRSILSPKSIKLTSYHRRESLGPAFADPLARHILKKKRKMRVLALTCHRHSSFNYWTT